MDSLLLRAVIAECRSLSGRTVSGVASFGDRPRWALDFGTRGSLVIDLAGAAPAVYATGLHGGAGSPREKAGPGRRPRAASGRSGISGTLEERLSGARMEGLESHGLDRVLVLAFERRDRFGDPLTTTVVVELFGAWGNLLVLDGPPDSGRILERLRPDRRREGTRPLERGQVYRFPARHRADLLLDGPEAVLRSLDLDPRPWDLAGWLVRFQEAVEGVGAATAREVIARTPLPLNAEGLLATWTTFVEASGRGDGVWIVSAGGGASRRISVVPPDGVVGPECEHQGSPSAAVETLLIRPDAERELPEGPWRRLAERIERRRREVARLKAKLTAELERRPDGALDRIRAETLLAHAAEIARGSDLVVLASPHGDGTIEIPLDPALGPAENARRYFREARKAAQAGEALPRRIDESEAELERIRGWSEELERLSRDDSAGIERLAVRIGGRGTEGRRRDGSRSAPDDASGSRRPGDPPPKSGGGPGRDRTPASLQPRRYDLPGGWVILVGRSQVGNDHLTHRLAAPHDMWFHVHGASGSHVVLKAPDRKSQPGKSLLLAAAGLAALNSKARHASRVPVIYTEKRYVRKPRGSKPGLAAVTNEKTLMVKPAEPPESGGDSL